MDLVFRLPERSLSQSICRNGINTFRHIGALTCRALIVLVIAEASVSATGCSRNNNVDSLIDAASEGDAAKCTKLVKSGVPIDSTDGDGDTALSYAVGNCKPDAVKTLLDLGANVNLANGIGITPLMYTATPFRGHVLKGAEAERNEVAVMLVSHGADVNRGSGDGKSIGDGQTALHFAAEARDAELVRVLLAAGADPTLKSNQGYTPLDVAKFPDYAPNDQVIGLLEHHSK